jgi:hypothetical protein
MTLAQRFFAFPGIFAQNHACGFNQFDKKNFALAFYSFVVTFDAAGRRRCT